MPKNKVFQQNFEKLKTEKVFKISKSPINVPPSLYKYLTDQNEACIWHMQWKEWTNADR